MLSTRGDFRGLLRWAFGAALAGAAACLGAQGITLFHTPTNLSDPTGIASGPDGNIWFTENNTHQVGRLTMGGVFTEFPTPSNPSAPHGIVAGPDGALWFGEEAANAVGRITTGGQITEYPMPTPTSQGGPRGIAVGSDGNLWFTEPFKDKIGRITTGGVITEFDVPYYPATPLAIAPGPDGKLWFTTYAGWIGNVTTSGTVRAIRGPHRAADPAGHRAGTRLRALVQRDRRGQDRSDHAARQRHRISHRPPGPGSVAEAVRRDHGRAGRQSLVHRVLRQQHRENDAERSRLALPVPGALRREQMAYGITIGPDGNIWFTDWRYSMVGRLGIPAAPSPVPISTATLAILAAALACAGVVLLRRA